MLALIAYRAADLVVRVLPAGAANRLARGIGRLAFALHLPARRALESNLARLLPEGEASGRARAGARRAFEHFALSIADFARLGHLPASALAAAVEVRGAEHLEEARRSGRGVILLSAHAGNWEWGAAWLAAAGVRVRVAARRHRSRSIEAFFARRRRARGVGALRGRPLWLSAARALRRREWVGLMGDRGVPGTHGRDAAGSACAWAAALARRTGAMVLPAVMLRRPDGGYVACFEPPLEASACHAGRYREAMRRHLEQDPTQWLAFEPLPASLG